MEKPQKFFAIHKETKEYKTVLNVNGRPHLTCLDLDMWQVCEDTRFKAKERLYNYIHKIVKKPYKPSEGTEIGKSIPILNF